MLIHPQAPMTVIIGQEIKKWKNRTQKDLAKHFNPGFVQLNKHCSFRSKACWPYRPQTKGKGDCMVRYVKEIFFLSRRHFESLAHIDKAKRPQTCAAGLRSEPAKRANLSELLNAPLPRA